jgi:hypothetical protein
MIPNVNSSVLHFIPIYGYFSVKILKDICDSFDYGQITIKTVAFITL